MKIIAIIYVGILGLLTHGVINEQQDASTPSTLPPLRGHVYDPRPYLQAPTTTTTIVVEAMSVRYIDRCPEWKDTVIAAGVHKDELATVMRIIYRESRCNPWAINDTKNRDGSIDYGLAQINDRTWCLPTKYSKRGYLQQQRIINNCFDLLNPETNVRALVALMEYSRERTGCPFTPWKLCDEQQ